MKIDKIIVKAKETTYPIMVGNGAISLLKSQVNKLCPNTKKIAILFDKNVPNIFKKKIKKLLKKYKIFIKDYTPSEELKNFSNVNILIEYLIKNKFNRNDLVIAVGGGIIGDFSGFVASIFKRGINFINIPTTLLAQVDSAIGGKTGVNSKTGKNLIGSFYQPKLVLSDISFLKSLPKREFICGFGEILKYSLIKDQKFFNFIKKNSKQILKGSDLNILKYIVLKSSKNKVHFSVAKESPVTFKVMEYSFDLMDDTQFNIAKRPDYTMPKPFVITDAVAVKRTFSIDSLKMKAVDTLPTNAQNILNDK